MSVHVVSISDMKVSHRPNDVIVTYSLGSCLGLTVYDPEIKVGGLIHCLLPDWRGNEEKARKNPYMFVNTGVPAMVKKLLAKKARRDRLQIKAAGCARMLNVVNQFDTGRNNLNTIKRLLEKNKIKLAGEDTGGTVPRTLYLHMDTGKVIVSSLGKKYEI